MISNATAVLMINNAYAILIISNATFPSQLQLLFTTKNRNAYAIYKCNCHSTENRGKDKKKL